jgi:ribosomal protein S18 acetylase RimI-like enzyme
MKDEFEKQTAAQPALGSTSAAAGLRAAGPEDQEFLLALFASTRSEELAGLRWDPQQAETFLKMQFNAQLHSYKAAFPRAENKIILLAERPVGRILVERAPEEFLLVDIALLPEQRNKGIGTGLIQSLLLEAAAEAKPVRLHVFNSNPAARLYERLGFFPISNDGAYLEMKWTG